MFEQLVLERKIRTTTFGTRYSRVGTSAFVNSRVRWKLKQQNDVHAILCLSLPLLQNKQIDLNRIENVVCVFYHTENISANWEKNFFIRINFRQIFVLFLHIYVNTKFQQMIKFDKLSPTVLIFYFKYRRRKKQQKHLRLFPKQVSMTRFVLFTKQNIIHFNCIRKGKWIIKSRSEWTEQSMVMFECDVNFRTSEKFQNHNVDGL